METKKNISHSLVYRLFSTK